MRKQYTILTLLLFITVSLFAEEFWYQSYEKALEAIKAGNWALAEQKLLESKSANPPKQGKRVKYYGTKFSHYYPDYYLALVYSKTGRNQEASQIAESVLASNIFSGSDPQLQELNNFVKPGGTIVEPLPAVPKVTPAEIATVRDAIQKENLDEAKRLMNAIRDKDPSNSELPKLINEYAKMETKLKDDQTRKEAQALIASAETALNQKKYDEARTALNSAQQKDPTNTRIRPLLDRLDRETKATADTALAQQINDARMLIKVGRLSDARKKVEPLRGKNVDADSLLAEISRKEKEYKEFEDLSTRATTFPDIRNAKSTIAAAAKKDPENLVFAGLLKNLGQKETTIQNEFNTNLAQAESSLQAKNYAEARRLAKKSEATKVDDSRVRTVLKKIDVEENSTRLDLAINQKRKEEAQRLFAILTSIAPSDPRIGGWKSRIESLGVDTRALDRVVTGPMEWDAMLAFYQGKYEQSIQLLNKVIAQNSGSVKAHFYLGCNHAALALMNPKEKNQELLSKAQQQFAQVRKLDSNFSYNNQFISPRIVEIFNQTR